MAAAASGKKFACCDEDFKDELQYQDHIILVHNGVDPKRQAAIESHAVCYKTNPELISKEKKQMDPLQFPCPECIRSFDSKKALEAHLKSMVHKTKG